jgi:hypothetical protein
MDEAFASEHTEAALAYARVVEADFLHFRAALEQLGPTLGVSPDDTPLVGELDRLFRGIP